MEKWIGNYGSYQPEGDDADDVHEDVAAITQYDGVQWDERLRRAEAHEDIRGRLVMSVQLSKCSLWLIYGLPRKTRTG